MYSLLATILFNYKKGHSRTFTVFTLNSLKKKRSRIRKMILQISFFRTLTFTINWVPSLHNGNHTNLHHKLDTNFHLLHGIINPVIHPLVLYFQVKTKKKVMNVPRFVQGPRETRGKRIDVLINEVIYG